MYTRRGDRGETSLFGPRRVSKDSPLVEAYGTIDELNSYLGVVISVLRDKKATANLKAVQRMLFVAGADMAAETDGTSKVPRITGADTLVLERMTDALLSKLPKLTNFIMPGGTRASAELHFARTLCRRAERRVVTASKMSRVNPELIPFLNRLSSYLFNLARATNAKKRSKEETWRA